MATVFGSQSTADEVLAGANLTGRRVLVTGTSAGLGVETARVLATHGAEVIGTARNLEKALAATAQIPNRLPNGGSFELIELDLASRASIRVCSDSLNTTGKSFDVIVANAGVMACPKGKTVDGFEIQFGTNHLGHFLLVNRIASLMRRGSRLVSLSSRAHRLSDIDLDDLNFDHTPYAVFGAYGRSKTANILFAVEFDRRHKAQGIRASAVHPGAIQTELVRYMTPQARQALIDALRTNEQSAAPSYRSKTIPQGAATTVWSAFVAQADLVGGRYCEDCHVAEVLDGNEHSGVRGYALDPQRAKALWARSEQLVGEEFPDP